MKRGKKYLEAASKIEKGKAYAIEEAVSLLKETKVAKFDETVELVLRLNLDTKKADQQLRGATVLPNGIGKTKKVLVLARGAKATEAKEAGADYVGEVDLIDKIANENWFDYDTIIATPDMMPALGKIGRVLGPKGLMPNPKTGTVTMDVKKAVEDVKKGRVEYRTDSYGNVAVLVGKASFDNEKLVENIKAFVGLINKTKPSTVKGKYMLNISVSTTMGPGIKVDTESFEN